MKTAYDFCFTARDVIQYFCGREFNESWLAAGGTNTLEIPKDYDGLYALTLTLVGYLTANPTQQNADLGVTSTNAQTTLNNLTSANTAILNQRALAQEKGQVRDEKLLAVRKRLSGLCTALFPPHTMTETSRCGSTSMGLQTMPKDHKCSHR